MSCRHATVMLRVLATLPGCGMPMNGSEQPALDVSFAGGERIFDLEWRTAAAPTGNGANPPFTATWKDITAAEATVGLCLHNAGLQVRGEASYGRIISGHSSLSAFADDSREQTTYRSDQRSDGGDTFAGMLALGVRASLPRSIGAVCEIGYSTYEQRMALTDGVQITPASGPYAGLDSRYHTRWQGPWLGMSGSWDVLNSWSLTAHCEYHWVEYHGDLDLNLRTDLAHPRSIDQSGSGHVLAAGAGIAYHLTRKTDIQLMFSREESRVANGRDSVNYSSGAHDDVPLNDVTLSAWILRCGLRWEY